MKGKKNLCSLSDTSVLEYCSTVCRVGDVTPIEGSDFLAKTVINGFDIVVRKDETKTGDIVIYVPIECSLNSDYLSCNNCYAYNLRSLNANAEAVEAVTAEGDIDKAKRMCGFFETNGRVRILKLRGTYSMGYLCTPESLVKWIHGTDADKQWFYDNAGFTFDTIKDKLFVKAYVPDKKGNRPSKKMRKYYKKKEDKFCRIIDFTFHYNTLQLNANMGRLSEDRTVTITPKLHGTSIICSNTLVNNPVILSKFDKTMNKVFRHCSLKSVKKNIRPSKRVGYGNVFSSRSEIRNAFLYADKDGQYKERKGKFVWDYVNSVIKDYIPKGFTLYGEVVGYYAGKIIQKGYDYGCNDNQCKLMIYRIHDNNTNTEYNVGDVKAWTEALIKKNPILKDALMPIPILYHGKLSDLYAELDTTENEWYLKALDLLKADAEHFGMEEKEPLCKNSVYREGVVIRMDDDPIAEAFKLKCKKFLEKEAKQIDKGEVDIELAENNEY